MKNNPLNPPLLRGNFSGTIHVGLIGFGTVGTGMATVLMEQEKLIARRLGANLVLTQIADVDIKRSRGINIKKISLTTNPYEIILNPKIDIIVELIGGIEPACKFILDAISHGKHIVTANKALLATHGEKIFKAAEEAGVEILFEGAVGGGIPIIRVMKEGLSADKITAIFGIVNGTSNYILTKMSEEGSGFSKVLKEAQSLGYAEADPTLDVGGGDSAHKLAILALLAFGTPIPVKDIFTEGIDKVAPMDIAFAEAFGYKMKLLAIAKQVKGKLEARVHPTMIPKDEILAKVNGVFNAVCVVGKSVGETLFYGRGAGSIPTGSAVVSDLISIARNILNQQGYGKPHRVPVPPTGIISSARLPLPIKPMAEIESRYYLRFMVEDRPGVLSAISGVLGRHHISIASVIQQGRKEAGAVPLVMMTHKAREKDIQMALEKINQSDSVYKPTVLIRVEGKDIDQFLPFKGRLGGDGI
ncbi:MAG: homoserine dehydrogenase [Nitrospirae bacterium]|nr:homoserine dehydrogenase [Candidatus Troglogloeales bacterium]